MLDKLGAACQYGMISPCSCDYLLSGTAEMALNSDYARFVHH